MEESLASSICKSINSCPIILINRLSPACHELRKVVITARTYGGAVRRRVSTSLFFKVATTVLKLLDFNFWAWIMLTGRNW